MARPRTKSTLHHHGCTECRRKYVCGAGDCPGATRCNPCRSGIESHLYDGWLPRECCIAGVPLPEMRLKADRDTYKLHGTPWFKCPTCANQYPCQPTQVRTTR